MDKLKRRAIKHHLSEIVSNMNAPQNMDQLQINEILSQADVNNVNSKSTREDQNRELVDILTRKGEVDKPFEHFMNALRKTHGHEWLAENIQKTYDAKAAGEGGGATTESTVYAQRNRIFSILSSVWFRILVGVVSVSAILGVIIVYIDSKNNDAIGRAADILRKFYGPRLFSDDSSLSTFSKTDIEKIWVDPTLEYNGKKFTDYRSLVNETFLKKDVLLFEGDRGTGKSFLLRKIMHDWTIGRFPQFKLALYFELRHMRNIKETVEELVYFAIESLFYKNSTDPVVVKNAITELKQPSESKSILVILQGYDEFNSSICEELKKLLSLDLIPPETQFKIMISAKTSYVARKNDGKFGRARILGFDTLRQKNDYIDKYFSIINNTTDAEKLKELLKSNKFLKDWSANPLHMTFICTVFQQLKKRTELELYEKIVIHHMRLHGEKSPDAARSVFSICGFESKDGHIEIKAITEDRWWKCSHLHTLGKLAFTKYFNRRGESFEFSQADLQDFQIPLVNISDFGFLVKEEINQEYTMYRFRHKSFQDFFAAFYCNTFNSTSTNDSVWHDYISTNNSIKEGVGASKYYSPSEFEYFLFQYAVANFYRDEKAAEKMRPLLRKYTMLEFSFSKADIKSEKELQLFLAELVNVTHISLSGTLHYGDITIPKMDNLQVLLYDALNIIHQNQTISPLPMKDLPRLISLTYRTCPNSIKEWSKIINAISQSRKPLKYLKIQCSNWSNVDSEFLFAFLNLTVKLSKNVKKLMLYKAPDSYWPPYEANKKMPEAVEFILSNSNFEEFEFSMDLFDYYHIRMTKFPSAKKKQMKEIYCIKLAVHRANSTLYLNLSQWGVQTEMQFQELLASKYANLTHLSISGQLKKGNLTIPKMNKLQSIEYSDISFLRPAFGYQTIFVPTRDKAPKLTKVTFLGCPWWSLNHWKDTLNSFSNGLLDLESLKIDCIEWLDAKNESWTINAAFFEALADSNISIKRLELFKSRISNKYTDSEADTSLNIRITEAIKQLIKRENIKAVVVNEEFIQFFRINMTRFVFYKQIMRPGKRRIYKIESEYKMNATIATSLSTEINATEISPVDLKKPQIIWSFIRYMNYSHMTTKAELSCSGKIVHQIITVSNITIINREILNNISAQVIESDSKRLNATMATYDCCPWVKNKKSRSVAIEKICEDQRPILFLNITSSDSLKMHLLVSHITELYFCKMAHDHDRVYILDLRNQHLMRSAIANDQKKCRSKKVRQRLAKNCSLAIELKVKPIYHYPNNAIVNQSHSLPIYAQYLPLLVQKHSLISAKIVSVDEKTNEFTPIYARELNIDITKIDISTGLQLYHYLVGFSKLITLTVRGNLLEGDIRLPPMSDLQTVKFVNITFSNRSQKIIALSELDFPSLEEVYYESCPWSWSEMKGNFTLQENILFLTNDSLHSLCSSLPHLKKLLIRCPAWANKSWQFIANFYAEIKNCTSRIDSVYLLKYPEDQWPTFDQKPDHFSMTTILNTLMDNANLTKIVLNEEFLNYNDIKVVDLPNSNKVETLSDEANKNEKVD